MLETREICFSPGGQMRRLTVYLPDGYRSEQRFPVLYLLDGQYLAGLFSVLPKDRILVGVESARDDRTRLREYTPYSCVLPGFGEVQASGKETAEWLVSECKPMIEREYATDSGREASSIAGLSLGASLALYLGICYSDVFASSVAVSPAITPILEDYLREISQPAASPSRLFLSRGGREYPDELREKVALQYGRLEERLKQAGYTATFRYDPAGRHIPLDWLPALTAAFQQKKGREQQDARQNDK